MHIYFIFFWLCTFLPNILSAQSLEKGSVVSIPISALSPTQPSASKMLVEIGIEKARRYITEGENLQYYLRANLVPVVIATPNDGTAKFNGSTRFYAADRHHLVNAVCAIQGTCDYPVQVIVKADYRRIKDPAALYLKLFENGFLYLGLNAATNEINVTKRNVLELASSIPDRMDQLPDNPFRYLSEMLGNGGYFNGREKQVYHQEFQWGDAIRKYFDEIDFRNFNPNDPTWYADALREARKFAISDAAKKLPGYLGPLAVCQYNLLARKK